MASRSLEIVAPAGSLESGIYAFNAGADAVYFGLTRFSARKGASNLSPSDAGRLVGVARKRGGRVYAALNTVIAEDEMSLAARTVTELVLAEVDAILIQDLGLARWIHTRFPEMPLHGSTQLAIHTREGLLAARRLSLSRVVLSRELSLEEIGALHAEEAGVALEVFAHGALCYGFSGLCLASSALTGRSGNRGECAQICRSWFWNREDKGYFFSCTDLEAGDLLPRLSALGVTAIKIEGRLKSSAYAYNTTAYYRALIDGDVERAARCLEHSRLSFARPQNSGFLAPEPERMLVNPAYPSHMGVSGARVLSCEGDRARIRALADLAAHDRLFRLPSAPPDRGETIVLSELFVNGKKRRRIVKGQTATLKGVRGLTPGVTLMKTLSHDMHLKAQRAERFPIRKPVLPLRMEIVEEGLWLATEALGLSVSSTFPATVEKRSGQMSFTEAVAKVFSRTGDFPFTFAAPVPFPDAPEIPADRFVPPSELKRIKNDFCREVARMLTAEEGAIPHGEVLLGYRDPMPPRSEIRYPDGFPFAAEGTEWTADEWPALLGRRFLALPPVTFDSGRTLPRFAAEIARRSDLEIAVGLSNAGHVAVAGEWARFPHVSFFLDYGIYAANLWTLAGLQGIVPRLTGAYLWLEATAEQNERLEERIRKQAGALPAGIRAVDRPDRFPLFISRICFLSKTVKAACRKSCSGTYDARLEQGRRRFRVQVRNCVTYVFLEQ